MRKPLVSFGKLVVIGIAFGILTPISAQAQSYVPLAVSPSSDHQICDFNRYRRFPTQEQKAAAAERSARQLALVRKGDQLLSEGKPDAAVAVYYDAFKVNRVNGMIMVKIARTLSDKGDITGAIKAYDEIFYPPANNNPATTHYSYSERNDLEHEMQYAILLHKAGRYEEAFAEYKRACIKHQDELSTGMIGRVPLDIVVTEGNAATVQLPAAAHLAAARDISIHGRDEEAAHEITEAIRLKPNYGLSYFYLADVMRFLTPEKQKAFGTRRAALEKAVALTTGAAHDSAKSDLIALSD